MDHPPSSKIFLTGFWYGVMTSAFVFSLLVVLSSCATSPGYIAPNYISEDKAFTPENLYNALHREGVID